MALSIGIVGLPNVGKSTTFNALTQAQNALAANYPFATIEPNKAIVAVPDSRVDRLAEVVQPKKKMYATVEFVDIAGLVAGASKGEGLGNQFLGNIRDTEAIIHVVRCFEDENVVHVNAEPEPIADIEVIQTELILADLQQLERKIEKLERQTRTDKSLRPQLEVARQIKAHLEEGLPIAMFTTEQSDELAALNHEMRFLTAKPVIYVANVDEDSLATGGNTYSEQVKRLAEAQSAEMVLLCAKLEEEMVGMTPEERAEFLALSGVTETGLAQVIRTGYHALGLISFLTAGPKEVRAWTVRAGARAPEAAGVIHTDFEKGFIRAEVIPLETFIECGSEAAAKAAGLMRVEGKEYVVADGDVIHFRFNV